jgi:hypothetical protein
MFKFLRRYSKWILAIGGTLLMITFLVPFAFEGLGNLAATRGAAWATIGADESKVSVHDYQQLQREREIVKFLNPALVHPIKIDSAQHWYLLTREAEQAGLIGGTEDGLSMLGENPAEALGNLRAQTGNGPDFVLQTIAKYRGVIRLVSMYRTAAHFSDRRLRSEARRLFHTANARFVVLEATADTVTEEPGEDAIQEQFEKYADKLPGEGEHGFGYKLPDRVKLEWIEIPADEVRAAVESSPEFNDIALRKHWRRNPKFSFPEITDGAAIPEVVRIDLAAELFNKRMEDIERSASDFLRAGTRGLMRSGSYYVLPDDWAQKRPSLARLAEELQSEYGIELPPYQATGDRWISASEVATLEGIGAARTNRFGPVAMPMSTLVAQTREFGKAIDAVIQEGIAGPPMRGTDDSLYFFRITATDASRRAADVSEVRALVVRDLKRLADYENLLTMLTALKTEAEKDGLLSLLVSHPRGEFFPQQNVALASLQSLMIQAQLGYGLSPMPSSIPKIGSNEEAVGAIIDHAMALPLMSMSDLAPEQKILTVPVSDTLAVLVVEIVENTPLTREAFNRGVDMGIIQLLLLNDELADGQDVAEAFSVDTLAQRNNFKLTQAPLEDEELDVDTQPGG